MKREIYIKMEQQNGEKNNCFFDGFFKQEVGGLDQNLDEDLSENPNIFPASKFWIFKMKILI
ncbi:MULTISPECIES: hypothetical protein [Chryseobacterium]|uniref:Bacteriocin-like protein n=1 Tax=Chryseobacterium geocarposphaerae TaxID=1416776 RepID=A0ABU1LBM5_9FLAO|nr:MULTISPECIES: hypothetical protein [Chryseobacterium]MDR6403965.1 hypothetical protein [Chryseobacterium geocarposphaerae]MDR6698516.1 hypothetical protein [Chryseobacterium ginsenosidimutans]